MTSKSNNSKNIITIMIISDRQKAPANLHYTVSNNSGSVFKKFGKDQNAAYDFAEALNETAIIRGFYIFRKAGKWQTNTVFIDHIFKN